MMCVARAALTHRTNYFMASSAHDRPEEGEEEEVRRRRRFGLPRLFLSSSARVCREQEVKWSVSC